MIFDNLRLRVFFLWVSFDSGILNRFLICFDTDRFVGDLVPHGGIKLLRACWWMPWQREAMKDVASCDKPRGAAKQAL